MHPESMLIRQLTSTYSTVLPPANLCSGMAFAPSDSVLPVLLILFPIHFHYIFPPPTVEKDVNGILKRTNISLYALQAFHHLGFGDCSTIADRS